jgi:hypothetical protein
MRKKSIHQPTTTIFKEIRQEFFRDFKEAVGDKGNIE